jgi:hypothetical protein
MRTLEQLQRIRDDGGMIAAMLKDDVQDTDRKGQNLTVGTYDGVVDDCRHSSKAFAQAYKYAIDTMQGPVAFGSDFNGVAGHVGPRFGSDACGGDTTEKLTQLRAGNKVTYPFTIDGFGTFDRQTTGQKTYDFNGDGLAHVGLLPDLVADLRAIGLTDEDLMPLFGSAEGFVDVWERGLAQPTVTPGGPTLTPTQSVTPGAPTPTPTQPVTPGGPTLTPTRSITPGGRTRTATATGTATQTPGGPTLTPTQPVTPGGPTVTATAPCSVGCVGDCDGNCSVAVNELIILVNIALGNADASACLHGVPDGVDVNISLLIQAVNHALGGC